MSKVKSTGSRRRFIKDVGGAAFGAAAASAITGVSGCASASKAPTGATYDWVVIGSGIEGGLAAAVFGLDKGFKTLVVEETGLIGGGAGGHGLFFVPGNHLMKEAGLADSRDDAISWLRHVGGGYNSPDFIETFVDHAPRAAEYLHRKAGIPLWITGATDFFLAYSEGGWRYDETVTVGSKKHGRSLSVEPFPAAALGDWRTKIRRSEYHHHLEELLEGQPHNPSLDPTTSGKRMIGDHVGVAGPLREVESPSLALWRKKYGAAKVDALLKKDEESFVAGPGIAAHLLNAILKRNGEVRIETRAERLVVENGRVVGVVLRSKGQEETIRVTRGVMLGTGLGEYGWRLASAVDGQVYAKIRLPALGTVHVQEAPGIIRQRGNYEVRMRHSIFVNRFGERFGNEESYQGMAGMLAIESYGDHRFRNFPNYFVFDRNLIDTYAFAGRPPGETEGLEWIAQGRTIAELAAKLHIDPAGLQATVARFNESARKGKDPDFHRTPGTMGAIEKPPFYGTLGHSEPPETDPLKAQICVVTNTLGQVMNARTKKPIGGLYCTTQLQEHQPVIGLGYQAGLHMAMGSAFSLLAAEHAAQTT